MKAAVYRGRNDVRVEDIPAPSVGPGEILLQIQACGVCGTDLKKIAHGDLPPPLVFGHEAAGRVAAVGAGATGWKIGDRAVFFHHIPCGSCALCRIKAYAQCPQYLRVGTTAGFEPAGGGFAEFVKVSDWIVAKGLVRIPADVSDEEAVFVEPVNTCLKGIEKAGIGPGQSVLILGAGPVGLILLQLARLKGAQVHVTDPIPERLEMAVKLGAAVLLRPSTLRQAQGERGSGRSESSDERPSRRAADFDLALVATPAASAIQAALKTVRPAGRVVLFAQTRLGESVPIDVGEIGKLEKELIGSYSASVDLQQEAAEIVFKRKIQLKPLITHRFGLNHIQEAFHLAMNPSAGSLKIIVYPNQLAHPELVEGRVHGSTSSP